MPTIPRWAQIMDWEPFGTSLILLDRAWCAGFSTGMFTFMPWWYFMHGPKSMPGFRIYSVAMNNMISWTISNVCCTVVLPSYCYLSFAFYGQQILWIHSLFLTLLWFWKVHELGQVTETQPVPILEMLFWGLQFSPVPQMPPVPSRGRSCIHWTHLKTVFLCPHRLSDEWSVPTGYHHKKHTIEIHLVQWTGSS